MLPMLLFFVKDVPGVMVTVVTACDWRFSLVCFLHNSTQSRRTDGCTYSKGPRTQPKSRVEFYVLVILETEVFHFQLPPLIFSIRSAKKSSILHEFLRNS